MITAMSQVHFCVETSQARLGMETSQAHLGMETSQARLGMETSQAYLVSSNECVYLHQDVCYNILDIGALKGYVGLVRCVSKGWRDLIDGYFKSNSTQGWKRTSYQYLATSLSMCQWGFTTRFRINMSFINYVVSNGCLDILRWLSENKEKQLLKRIDDRVFNTAALFGKKHIIAWIKDRYPNKYLQYRNLFDLSFHAVLGGHFHILEYTHELGLTVSPKAFYLIPSRGHLDMLKWVVDKFTIEKRLIFWDACMCQSAARGGHLDVLEWLHLKGCPWNEMCCADAALRGHLDVLKWLREKGCPWDRRTIHSAVIGGYLDVLKWLYAEGCPMRNIKYYNIAANHGNLEIVKWYAESSHETLTNKTLEIAAERGHYNIVEWMTQNGFKIGFDIVNVAAEKGHLNLLKWARSKGFPLSDKTCYIAAKYGQLNILEWLLKKKCPYDYKKLYFSSKYDIRRNVHIQSWLASEILNKNQIVDIMTDSAMYF